MAPSNQDPDTVLPMARLPMARLPRLVTSLPEREVVSAMLRALMVEGSTTSAYLRRYTRPGVVQINYDLSCPKLAIPCKMLCKVM
jgi:hypothetical protein